MPAIEPLLQPILEDKPSGIDLKYFKAPLDSAPLFDKIRNARKMEDIGPMGHWATESKPADFNSVARWCTDALATQTKDLQLAAWLTEAWTYGEGVKGLIAGLNLLRELILRFWDTLYPEIEEDDTELRAAPLDWVGSYFDAAKGSSPILALRNVPITNGGLSWFSYQESRRIGFEAEVASNPARKSDRAIAIKENKTLPENFDKDFEATKKLFYKELAADLKAALVCSSELDQACHEKFKEGAPSFAPLRKALDEVANVVHILLLKKLQKEPDPIAIVAAAVEDATPEEVMEPVEAEVPQADLSQLELGAIKSEAQAMLHVVAAAQYYRRKNPGHPASYLLLRALRWGELRGAIDVQHADLPAPLAEVRKSLRSAAAAGNWKGVLESAEGAMSNPCGRGWLDLQRYAIRASTELGYAAAAKAIRSELKSLLADFPDLTKATLNDDTGAANPETLEWLKQEGLIA